MENILVSIALNQQPWYKQWFNSAFYHQLYAHRDKNEASGFIDALLDHLQPAENASMLDLGCGAGRHAHYLAANGYQVTGLDLSSNSIQQAKKEAGSNTQFYTHDMRKPFGTMRFDYVFSFFTSFGYFTDENDNHRVIRNIFHSLKPGGTVVMDYLNVAWSEAAQVPEEQKEIDGIIYDITRWSDEKFFYKNIEIKDGREGSTFEYLEQVSKLSIQDFEYLFTSNGLRLKQVFGNYRLDQYNERSSPRMIMVAERPGSFPASSQRPV